MDLWGVKRNLFAVNFEVSNSRLRVPYTSPPLSLGFKCLDLIFLDRQEISKGDLVPFD